MTTAFVAHGLITFGFGLGRMAGAKGNSYKALAHCYVGLLFGLGFGMGIGDAGRPYLALAVALTVVEVGAFLVTRVWPWWIQRKVTMSPDECCEVPADRLASRLQKALPPAPIGAAGPLDLKGNAASVIKTVLSLAARLGGTTLEDLADEHSDLIDDFIPDEVFALIERIAHRLQPPDHPHPVGR